MSKPKPKENQIARPKSHRQSPAKLGCKSRSAWRQSQGPSQQSPRFLGSETVSWDLSHGARWGKVTVILSQGQGGGSSWRELTGRVPPFLLSSRPAAGSTACQQGGDLGPYRRFQRSCPDSSLLCQGLFLGSGSHARRLEKQTALPPA